jgi:hypothetical protein
VVDEEFAKLGAHSLDIGVPNDGYAIKGDAAPVVLGVGIGLNQAHSRATSAIPSHHDANK